MTNYSDNPQVPSITSDAYLPDQLIAGRFPLVTDTVTLLSGQNCKRGSVLGKVTVGAASSAAKSGGNAGNGTLTLDGTTPVLAGAKVGVYTVRCIAAATDGGTFRVEDPEGFVLGDVAVAATFSDDIKFVIEDGSADFIVGDGFDITVAAGSGKYKLSAATATDGSATPVAVLVDDVDASGGDKLAGVYVTGEFNGGAMTFGTGHSATTAATIAALRDVSIFIKSAVSAADPS